MSVQFPGVGATVYSSFTPNTVANAANGINSTLVAAGWTSVSVGGQIIVTVSSLPTNGQTMTVGGVTYTFQTSLNNAVANNITIQATNALMAQVIADAILAVTGGGTEWSTPTVANPICTATNASNVITFSSIAVGFGAGTSFTFATSSGAWGSFTSQGRSYVLTSATTPQGLAANLYVVDTRQNQSSLTVWWGSSDGVLQSGNYVPGSNQGAGGYFGSITITGGRTLQILANAFQFFTWLTGDNSTQGCQVGMCIPYLRAGQTATAIGNVSNSSGLIEITTSTAHGLTTGMNVSLWGIGGSTLANGTWVVTVIDSTHFTLNGSTFSGSYTSGGLVGGSGGAGNASGISRCFFGWMDWTDNGGGGHTITWRNQPGTLQGFYCINEFNYGMNTGGGGGEVGRLLFPRPDVQNVAETTYQNWGGFSNSSEALFGWPGTAINAAFRAVGELWGALVVTDTIPMDATNIGYLGHNWINQTNNATYGSLWLATT